MSDEKREAEHRGHRIYVSREECLAGYPLLYYSVFRISDGYECVCSFEDSEETLDDMVQFMKNRIDNELLEADPWGENDS